MTDEDVPWGPRMTSGLGEMSPRDEADRLLIVAREMTRGGAAYLALRHAQALRADYPVDVLVTGQCDEEFLAEFPEGVTFYRPDSATLPRDELTPLALRSFARANRDVIPFRRHYRAMMATSVFPDPVAAAACTIRARRHLVFLVDESLATCAGYEPRERAVVERCVREADLILPVSRRLRSRMADRFPALRDRQWQCLRPPVDVDSILRLADVPQGVVVPGAVPNVLSISRLSPDKQIGQCLRIHRRLKDDGLRFRWFVVGAGEEEARVRDEIRALGMEEDFVLLGHRDDVYAILKACDVFALLSRSEGCPTVVLEALALGRPVIMTDVNGSDELIEHEQTGLVVAHDFDAIADGLGRIVGDEGMRRRFRENLAAGSALRDGKEAGPTLLDLVAGPDPAPPRVSILIPTYNQARFIDRAILGALGQDYPSLEVVVLDDTSTDDTGPVAQSWEFDRRFRYVRNETNLGRVANYRRGLVEHARGEWALMLDGDDFLTDPGFISRAIDSVDRHRDRPIVFAQAGHRAHFPDGRRGDVDILPPIDGEERVLAGAEYLRFLFETAFFTHLGTLYRRDLAIRSGAYTADISSSDMESLMRLALEGEVVLLNRIAGCWVQHGANASSSLALSDLGANARIFRQAARRAVERGLSSWQELDGPLTRYEARTLIILFDLMIRDAPRGPADLARFLGIAFSTNPGLFRDGPFLAACRGYARALVQPSLARSRSGRLALRLLRAARFAYRRLGGKPMIEALAR